MTYCRAGYESVCRECSSFDLLLHPFATRFIGLMIIFIYRTGHAELLGRTNSTSQMRACCTQSGYRCGTGRAQRRYGTLLAIIRRALAHLCAVKTLTPHSTCKHLAIYLLALLGKVLRNTVCLPEWEKSHAPTLCTQSAMQSTQHAACTPLLTQDIQSQNK